MEKIIYLARKLKSFSFDDIFLLAETPKDELKNFLDELVEEGQLKRLSTGYVFIDGQDTNIQNKNKVVNEKEKNTYGIFIPNHSVIEDLSFYETVNKFLEEYATKFCKINTVRTYESLFRNHILPYFKDKTFNDIDTMVIKGFFNYCSNKKLSSRRIKNTLALLKQFLQYAKDKGLTDISYNFQVKRLTSKNEFDLSRVIFE